MRQPGVEGLARHVGEGRADSVRKELRGKHVAIKIGVASEQIETMREPAESGDLETFDLLIAGQHCEQ